MHAKSLKTHRKIMQTTQLIFKDNPVLAMGLGLSFVIVPALTLKNGVAISIILSLTTIVTVMLSALIGKNLKTTYKLPLLMIFSMIIVTVAVPTIDPTQVVKDALGIYVPLVATNGVLIYLLATEATKTHRQAILDAFKICIGFTIVICTVSALREILVSKSVWGIEFALYPIRLQGVKLPFFGFVLLGFAGAAFRRIDRFVSARLLIHDYKSFDVNKVEEGDDNA